MHRLTTPIAICVLSLGCEDPPPAEGEGAFLLGIRTVVPAGEATLAGGLGEDLSGLTGLAVRVSRVDVVHRTDVDDPTTERVLTVDQEEREFELTGDLASQAPRTLGFFNVPAGFVYQIRMVIVDAAVTLRGETFEVTVPSGAQSGLKVEPVDGVPFRVNAGERSGARIILNPFFQLIRNQGTGFHIKPLLRAEHVELADLSSIVLDRAVVRFADGVSRQRIEEINAEIGASIIDLDRKTNYYIMYLPVSISLADALEYYTSMADEVLFAAPDNIIMPRDVLPCDEFFDDPGPFVDVRAPAAWEITQGSRTAILADIDGGFDLGDYDMLGSWYVNQGELRGFDAFDVDGDGIVTDVELLTFDVDGDEIISFFDLNAAENEELCGPGPRSCNQDADDAITPLDLVDGLPALFGFEDGIDNDGNGRIDDLVGWDFDTDSNLPQNGDAAEDEGCGGSHGLGTSGIIAAHGAAPGDPGGVCLSTGVVGLNWVARLIPIKHNGFYQSRQTRATAFLAIRYAADLGADAINASWGVTFSRGADPGCGRSIPDLGDKYDDLLATLAAEAASLELGNSLLVAAVDNCDQDDDLADIFDWPPELDAPNIIGVTGTTTGVTPPELAVDVAFGRGVVDIAAPADLFTVIDIVGIPYFCGGTSFAAPLVTGTVGLLIANEPSLKGDASALKKKILCNTSGGDVLGDKVASGLLNVEMALLDPVPCP
jgi:hypothetical protein